MGKLLIISNDISVIEAVERRLKSKFSQIVICSHKESIEAIKNEKPTHIFIGEYKEEKTPKDGAATWYEILEKNLVDREVVVLAGHDKYNINNYLSMPLDMNKLEEYMTGRSG